MIDKLICIAKYVGDLLKAYFFRAPNGFRLASTLAVTFIALQGIKVVSAWLKFEVTFPGVDSIPGAIVVVLVSSGLILGQCFLSKMVPSQNEFFREVLRLRELGLTLAEIEARVQTNRQWAGSVFASIQEHSIPIPVRLWPNEKLRTTIGSEEFSELVARSIPQLEQTETSIQNFVLTWISDSTFKTKFETTNDVIAWVLKNLSSNGTESNDK